jgi:hypothetical protein
LTSAAQTLHDFVLSLLTDDAARSAFGADPSAALAGAGLQDVTPQDVQEVIPLVMDYAPAGLPGLPTTGPADSAIQQLNALANAADALPHFEPASAGNLGGTLTGHTTLGDYMVSAEGATDGLTGAAGISTGQFTAEGGLTGGLNGVAAGGTAHSLLGDLNIESTDVPADLSSTSVTSTLGQFGALGDPASALGALGDPASALGALGDPASALGALGDPASALGALGDPASALGALGDPTSALDSVSALGDPASALGALGDPTSALDSVSALGDPTSALGALGDPTSALGALGDPTSALDSVSALGDPASSLDSVSAGTVASYVATGGDLVAGQVYTGSVSLGGYLAGAGNAFAETGSVAAGQVATDAHIAAAQVASLPDAGSLPAVPALPALPAVPGLPGVAAVPAVPGVPAVPDVHDVLSQLPVHIPADLPTELPHLPVANPLPDIAHSPVQGVQGTVSDLASHSPLGDVATPDHLALPHVTDALTDLHLGH